MALSDTSGAVVNPYGIDVSAAIVHKAEHGEARIAARHRGGHERGADRARLRRARPGRARAGADRRQRAADPGAHGLRGGQRADDARRRRGARGSRDSRPAGRARERRWRRRLLLRVGSGSPGVLLEGVRGEREAQRHRRAGVRGDLVGAGAVLDEHADAPPTASPSSASRRRRRREGSTREPAVHCVGCAGLPERAMRRTSSCTGTGLSPLRAPRSRPCAHVCGDDFELVDISSDTALERQYRHRIPLVEIDGIERFTYEVDEDAFASASERSGAADAHPTVPRDHSGRPWAECARLSQAPRGGVRAGSLDGRCRSASEPVPAGADPGEEDGQGSDLLPGDRRVHEHQRDPDPA